MDIALDFIKGLSCVHDKSVILTVVDRFSKYAHFIALSHPYTATMVTTAFFDAIIRLPNSIVSDRDPIPCSLGMSGMTSSSWPASSCG